MHEKKLYLTQVEMGHHALAHGSTSLLVGKQCLGEMEMEERESSWFESKRSQSIHRQHNNMKMRSVLRVTPHPPYIVFPRDFRVLIPWLRIQLLFWAFIPFCPNFSPFYGFSPFLKALAPRGAILGSFLRFLALFFILGLFWRCGDLMEGLME